MKKCEHIPAKSRFVTLWRLLTCAKCRQYRKSDALINAEVRAFRKVSTPAQGLERTLQTIQNAQGGMPFSVELARKRNRLLSPKHLRAYGVVACGLLLTAGVTFHELIVDPTVNIPSPTMPKPNAYDYYYEAGKMTEALKAESKTVSDMETDLHDLRSHIQKFTPQMRAEAIEKFEPALTRMREGFQYPFMNPPLRSASQLLPQFASFRNLARTLTLESDVYADQADWGEAINSRLDSLYLGRECPKDGTLIAGLVSIAIQAIGRAHTQPIIENLSAEEARSAVKRMESILSEEVSYAQILREEKLAMQASLMEIFHQISWRTSYVNLLYGGENSSSGSWSNRMQALRFLFVNKRASMKNITEYCDAIIAEAELPYRKSRPAPPVPNDMLSQIFCPVFSQAEFKFVQNQTDNRMMLTALALQAYRAERKAYPASLQELVKGKYLSELPRDSFNLGQPLKYVNQGAKYLLYSVGPDGIDDGGKPAENSEFYGNNNIPRPQKPGSLHLNAAQIRQLHQMSPQSEGDDVYQVNTR